MSWQLLFALWVSALGGFLSASLIIISRRSRIAAIVNHVLPAHHSSMKASSPR